MTDNELVADFKNRLGAVLTDLKENGQNDPEAMWLMGSLAARIIDSGARATWPELKSALTPESYDSLLKQFEEQGNELHRNGNDKAAYAMQAIAISLIASRIDDANIAGGNTLLDEFIAQTVQFYRKNASAAKPN